MSKIGIIGCGWLGLHIAEYFKPKNVIYTTTRTFQKRKRLITLGYNPTIMNLSHKENKQFKTWDILNSLDTIIITVPFSKHSKLELIKNQFVNLISFIKNYDRQLFLMSSIGIYPQSEIMILENTFNETDLDVNILSIEKLIKSNFNQVNILRLGGLMGGDRIFSNYVKPSSDTSKIANHIHFKDISQIIDRIISEKVHSKIYNVVAPIHPTKQEIINYQKKKNIIVEKRTNNRIVLSDKLINELGYSFQYPNPIKF